MPCLDLQAKTKVTAVRVAMHVKWGYKWRIVNKTKKFSDKFCTVPHHQIYGNLSVVSRIYDAAVWVTRLACPLGFTFTQQNARVWFNQKCTVKSTSSVVLYHVVWYVSSYTLKKEATCSYETLARIYPTRRRHLREESNYTGIQFCGDQNSYFIFK
jgi:hypothetical protein